MANGRLNKKYYPIIWVALLLACVVRNVYEIVYMAATVEPTSALGVFWLIIRYALTYGVVPMAVVFLCAFVVWHIGAWRFVRSVPRTDFCYLVMAGTAIVKFFVGIIEVFSILEPSIRIVTTTVLDFTLLTGMMIGLFFLMSKWYHLNPVESYNAFKMWFIVYMIVGGIAVISSNSIYLSVLDGSTLGYELWEMLNSMGVPPISEIQLGASVAVICIYIAYLIAIIVVGEMLRRKSDRFRNPETRGDYYEQFDNRAYKMRGDTDVVFGDTGAREDKKKDEKVFDEFDI